MVPKILMYLTELHQVLILQFMFMQVIKGLDEGIMSMKVGGKRRLYIPGEVFILMTSTQRVHCKVVVLIYYHNRPQQFNPEMPKKPKSGCERVFKVNLYFLSLSCTFNEFLQHPDQTDRKYPLSTRKMDHEADRTLEFFFGTKFVISKKVTRLMT